MCEYMQSEYVRVKQGKVFFLNILREFFKENILSENEMLKITFLQNRPLDHPCANDKNVTPSQKSWFIEFLDFEFWRLVKDVPTHREKISDTMYDTCFDRSIKLF